jgi:hypothetical protein
MISVRQRRTGAIVPPEIVIGPVPYSAIPTRAKSPGLTSPRRVAEELAKDRHHAVVVCDLQFGERIAGIVGIRKVRVEAIDPQPRGRTDHFDHARQLALDHTHPPHPGVELQMDGHVPLARDVADERKLLRSDHAGRDVVLDPGRDLIPRKRSEYEHRQRDAGTPQLQRLFEERNRDHRHQIRRQPLRQFHGTMAVAIRLQHRNESRRRGQRSGHNVYVLFKPIEIDLGVRWPQRSQLTRSRHARPARSQRAPDPRQGSR